MHILGFGLMNTTRPSRQLLFPYSRLRTPLTSSTSPRSGHLWLMMILSSFNFQHFPISLRIGHSSRPSQPSLASVLPPQLAKQSTPHQTCTLIFSISSGEYSRLVLDTIIYIILAIVICCELEFSCCTIHYSWKILTFTALFKIQNLPMGFVFLYFPLHFLYNFLLQKALLCALC